MHYITIDWAIMEHTIRFVIDGVLFYIEAKAFATLNNFLRSIKNNYPQEKEKRVLESKAAEILLLQLTKGTDYTSLEDILYMMKKLSNNNPFFGNPPLEHQKKMMDPVL